MSDIYMAADTETTGLIPSVPFRYFMEGSQIIQLGAVVLSKETGEVIDTFKTKIRFEGTHNGVEYGRYPGFTWSDRAELIHGMSVQSLIREPNFEEAANLFSDFTHKHFKPTNRGLKIPIIAHNPHFDKYHIEQLLYLGGKSDEVTIDHRMIDTHTIGKLFYGTEYSDQLFTKVGMIRDKHDAEEDAHMCQRVYQMVIKDIQDAYKRLSTIGT